tara:strand:- start:519 stop:779 length:261 start_codon:yes stop_codon:yes gene_type:complete
MGCGSSSPVSDQAPKKAPKEAPIPTKEWAGDDKYNSLLADAKAFEATGDKTNEDYYHELKWKYEDVKNYLLSDDAGYKWKAVIPIA